MKRKTLIIGCLLSAFTCSANTYHVAKNGMNTNAGSEFAPFLTISHAARIAVPGDSIIVHEGVYREWVSPNSGGLNKDMRIVYMAAPGEKVAIKGSEEIKNWKKHSKNIWSAEINNKLFNSFNPFEINVFGDWLHEGQGLHIGEVYINNKALSETSAKDSLTSNSNSWFAEVGATHTTVYANFGDLKPSKSCIEVNVRPACFFPKATGVNFITVKGFEISQAATQWAPPTAQQDGMVGPHWSKGWVIEDCEISNSKCVGISLGKERASGHNLWSMLRKGYGYRMHGFNREIEAILKASDLGWTKDNIGSHVIRNNKIHDCGQAGIVGHLGGVFSTISHNEIYNINIGTSMKGFETAGIKLHAAIDVVIEDNVITNSNKGIWLDWQAQGTHVTRNIFSENVENDLFIEVSHGPTLVYNNIMLSRVGLLIDAQGVAFFNNLVGGNIKVRTSSARYTPYHYPHSTKVKGFYNNNGGDVRFYNNVFLGNSKENKMEKKGLNGYNEYPVYCKYLANDIKSLNDLLQFKLPVWIGSNIYFNGAQNYIHEQNFVKHEKKIEAKLEKEKDGYYIRFSNLKMNDLKNDYLKSVSTATLGQTIMSETVFENNNGTKFKLETDFFRNKLGEKRYAGPVTELPSLIWSSIPL